MTDYLRPEALIIGGGAAGRAAALVLGGARRDVVLVDAGNQSNRASTAIGGLLGHDGISPSDFYDTTRGELDRYPTVTMIAAAVTGISPCTSAQWHVDLDADISVHTDRILFATGMQYTYPDIDGIEQFWGSSVFHCPYCHGWEHRDQHLVILGGGPLTVDRTLLLTNWSNNITLITAGTELDDGERSALDAARVHIVDASITRATGEHRDLRAIELDNGTTLQADAMLVPAPHALHDNGLFGLQPQRSASGHVIVDQFNMTNLEGIWAAGDLVNPVASVSRAIADGSNSGIWMTHHITATTHDRPFPPRPR